ncbi:MAG: glycosyltransferase family 4 protein [Chloroflexi bacterium]|nr:glycosyltransferase family 4 protein [Chloroflexota bacterium]
MPAPTRRILFVTAEFPPRRGGIADHVIRLRSSLEDLGARTYVATEAVSQDSPVDRVYRLAPNPWCRQIVSVLRLVRRFRNDIVHIQYQAGAFDSALQAPLMPWALRLMGFGGLVVVTFHDLAEPFVFPRAGRLRRRVVDLLRGWADVCIYVDALDRACVSARIPGEWRRSQYIPAGPTIEPPPSLGTRDEARRDLGLPADAFLIGFFGFRQAGKGLEVLAAAMRNPALTKCGARLALIGGAGPDIGARRAAAPVPPSTFAGVSVLEPGYLEAPDISRWLRACDVAALPYDDGLSTRRGSFMVAAAHGLPVVTTTPVRPDLLDVRPGEVAFTPVRDPESLAAALVRVRDDPEYRSTLEAGSQAVARRYSWRRIARQTLDAYGG